MCYSDHNEDIRVKGSCDYCNGTQIEYEIVECDCCGKEFENSNNKKGEEPVVTFCSQECDTKWYRENVRGYEDYNAPNDWY